MDEDDLQVPLQGFEDVKPIPQDDGFDPVVGILYPHNYVIAMDYLRALDAAGEIGTRTLEMTHIVLEYNSSHYTAWQIRRRCLFALGMDLRSELEAVVDVAGDNPKNYQVWYHRRALTERLRDPGNEIEYVDRVVENDPKNYHAWSHRKWLLEEFHMLDEEEGRNRELATVDKLLAKDLRNNSAWNHRWFVVHAGSGSRPLPQEVVRSEVAYALSYAERAPSNESSWNYLRGFFRAGNKKVQEFPEVKERVLALKVGDMGQKSPYVHSTLAEIYEEKCTEKTLNEAIDLLRHLRDKLDPMRAKHWDRRLRAVAKRLDNMVTDIP